jgi:hypothetical protein
MKNRSYRRYKEEVVVKRRIKSLVNRRSFYWGYIDVNGTEFKGSIKWMQIIGTNTAHMFKTHVTSYYDSRDKLSYSGKNRYERNGGFGTRVYDKRKFYEELKNNNLEFKNIIL